jgi:hypothetical protein
LAISSSACADQEPRISGLGLSRCCAHGYVDSTSGIGPWQAPGGELPAPSPLRRRRLGPDSTPGRLLRAPVRAPPEASDSPTGRTGPQNRKVAQSCGLSRSSPSSRRARRWWTLPRLRGPGRPLGSRHLGDDYQRQRAHRAGLHLGGGLLAARDLRLHFGIVHRLRHRSKPRLAALALLLRVGSVEPVGPRRA